MLSEHFRSLTDSIRTGDGREAKRGGIEERLINSLGQTPEIEEEEQLVALLTQPHALAEQLSKGAYGCSFQKKKREGKRRQELQ